MPEKVNRLTVSEIAENLEKMLKTQRKVKPFVKEFVSGFKDRKLLQKFSYFLFMQADSSPKKIDRYIKSLYFSKNYRDFKSLTPIEVVKYVRFYLGKRGTRIPLSMTPLLLKKARSIKRSIEERIRYRQKKSILADREVIFEELKKEYLKKEK